MKIIFATKGLFKKMASEFWKKQFNPATGLYTCTGCGKSLKPAVVTKGKEENMGKTFLGCSKQDGRGGCGLFSWIDGEPREQQGNPREQKRLRVAEPSVVDANELARLAAQMAVLQSKSADHESRLKMLEEP